MIKQIDNPKTLPIKINKELEKLHGKVLFPEKLKQAKETLARVGLPNLPKK